jgi:crotonobetainyl-CoA:carnitine CoA-transferase CaiB-like acyl-CoA transferase
MSFQAWDDLAVALPELRGAEPLWRPGRPAVPSHFRIDEAAAAVIGAAATAAAELGRRRGLPAQRVAVETRRAGASLQSFMHLRLDGAPSPTVQGEIPTMAVYRCADGRWIHLHGALTHLRDGTLRILAGPTCARTLAEHGADVLRVASPRLPEVEAFLPDTSHGKRSAWLDLDEPGATEALRALVAGADVFSQGYRGGALEARGFGADALAQLRPGIVVVSRSAYGHRGPWAARRGWEQLAQACTGIALEHSACAADARHAPAVIPAAPSDYCSGYLAALGATIALLRQCEQGGSWHVRVSLARTAMWIRELGHLPGDSTVEPPTRAEIESWSITRDTPWGRLGYLAPVAQMSATPPAWTLPSAPPGSHAAAWC